VPSQIFLSEAPKVAPQVRDPTAARLCESVTTGATNLPCPVTAARQNRPMVRPSPSISMPSAAGSFPSPGIWVISPHSGTSQPAPV
jgi:hypothetical protein